VRVTRSDGYEIHENRLDPFRSYFTITCPQGHDVLATVHSDQLGDAIVAHKETCSNMTIDAVFSAIRAPRQGLVILEVEEGDRCEASSSH
jgi:hypothetical protein